MEFIKHSVSTSSILMWELREPVVQELVEGMARVSPFSGVLAGYSFMRLLETMTSIHPVGSIGRFPIREVLNGAYLGQRMQCFTMVLKSCVCHLSLFTV